MQEAIILKEIDDLLWCPNERMIADALTKRVVSPGLLIQAMEGIYFYQGIGIKEGSLTNRTKMTRKRDRDNIKKGKVVHYGSALFKNSWKMGCVTQKFSLPL